MNKSLPPGFKRPRFAPLNSTQWSDFVASNTQEQDGNNNGVTVVESITPQGDKEDESLEYRLSRKSDRLNTFVKLVAGSAGVNLTDMFIREPDVTIPSADNNQFEVFKNSLNPVVVSALARVEIFMIQNTRGKVTQISDIREGSALWLSAADLTALFYQQRQQRNPFRSGPTKSNLLDDKRALATGILHLKDAIIKEYGMTTRRG